MKYGCKITNIFAIIRVETHMIHPHRQKWPSTRKNVGEATFLPRLSAKNSPQRIKVRVSVYQRVFG